MENHRSFRQEQEFLLLPVYDQARPALAVAAVFGANASGKSNLLDALRWMQSAVLGSYRVWEPEAGVPRQPYRLDVAAVEAPSSFLVELDIPGGPYQYGFTVDDHRVIDEWLYTYPHQRERVVFTRRHDTVELGSTVPERRTRADLLGGLLRDNALLLSVAAQAGQDEVLPIYRWFRTGLRFADQQRSSTEPELADRVWTALRRFPDFVDLVKVADLGITGVRVVETGLAPSAVDLDHAARSNPERRMQIVKPTIRRELVYLHGADGVALGRADQSDGTIAWTELLVGALDAIAGGAVLVVDEVDASLHPRLTARLIELFRNPAANDRGAQLVFSTHDATLLGTSLGDEVLKRDEIWFVEKKDGTSRLYPLSDFHPRKGENRERRYLAGSYGAVPAVFEDSLVDTVLAAKAESSDAQA